MNRNIALLVFFFLPLLAYSQTGIIRGKVVDKLSHQAVPFAPVGISVLGVGVTTDTAGVFEMKGLLPGVYNVEVNVLGYKPVTVFEVPVSGTRVKVLEIELEEQLKDLQEVEVRPDAFVRREESPLSAYTIGEVEVKRNPGSNRDVSKALQSLPGVAATASFRNDLIIRGGSSYENRFYLDGVEVPNINHFSTQGATGGPVGMINVDFIRDVDFYSGAFPAQRGNTLSSVLDFKLKEGRTDKTGYTFTLGATDLAATVDGPIGNDVTYIASWRRSYLQFLFQAIGLPFLPRYDDFLTKFRWKIDDRNEITFIGLGAYDVVTLNEEDNETDYQKYILGYIPENNQWNYTAGASYKHYRDKGYSTLVLSRNVLFNQALKYQGNDESSEANKVLQYSSRETENKLRWENVVRTDGWKAVYGAALESAEYSTTTFNRLPFGTVVDYSSAVTLFKYGAFAQLSRSFFSDKLSVSAGLRADANSYSTVMSNPLEQISPRVAASWAFTDRIRLNANAGRYYQLPPYTVLGYKDASGAFVNRQTAKYIRCDHLVAGVEYTTRKALRVALEGFRKMYSRYPFDLRDSVSLANLGNDFGVIGNVPVSSDNEGISTGVELSVQQKFNGHLYGIFAYTFLRSEFQDINGNYIPSSWDYRHTVSLTGGYYFKRNWEVGARFRYNSGQPYTPYDTVASLQASNWDITGQAIPDKSRINSAVTGQFRQVDIRVDKKYFFKKWSLDLYLDIQNLLGSKTVQQPFLTAELDANGNPVPDTGNPGSYKSNFIENASGTRIPTIGFVAEF
jgi:outer membrane receptor for ferrienterochelin and colicin